MAQFFKQLCCMFGKHSPARRMVRYEGHLKVGPCKYCGKQLEKRADGRWAARLKSDQTDAGKAIQED